MFDGCGRRNCLNTDHLCGGRGGYYRRALRTSFTGIGIRRIVVCARQYDGLDSFLDLSWYFNIDNISFSVSYVLVNNERRWRAHLIDESRGTLTSSTRFSDWVWLPVRHPIHCFWVATVRKWGVHFQPFMQIFLVQRIMPDSTASMIFLEIDIVAGILKVQFWRLQEKHVEITHSLFIVIKNHVSTAMWKWLWKCQVEIPAIKRIFIHCYWGHNHLTWYYSTVDLNADSDKIHRV